MDDDKGMLRPLTEESPAQIPFFLLLSGGKMDPGPPRLEGHAELLQEKPVVVGLVKRSQGPLLPDGMREEKPSPGFRVRDDLAGRRALSHSPDNFPVQVEDDEGIKAQGGKLAGEFVDGGPAFLGKGKDRTELGIAFKEGKVRSPGEEGNLRLRPGVLESLPYRGRQDGVAQAVGADDKNFHGRRESIINLLPL